MQTFQLIKRVWIIETDKLTEEMHAGKTVRKERAHGVSILCHYILISSWFELNCDPKIPPVNNGDMSQFQITKV